MSYCQLSDVLSKVGRLAANGGIGASTTPSTTDLQAFITNRGNQIDAVLASRGLAVPVTSPAWFVGELLRLNAEGAAADAHLAAYLTNDTNDRGAGELMLKSFETTLQSWVKGEGIPVAVQTQETDLAVRSNATQPDYDPERNEPMFRRRMHW